MKKVVVPVLILILFSLGSCITIIEKYAINEDGSGKMEYLVDMSDMYDMMQTLSDEDDMEDLDVGQSFDAVLPDLDLLGGISNAEMAGNPEKYVFGVRFDFNDIESLNTALGLLFEDDENTSTMFVKMKRRKFIRYHAMSDEFSRDAFTGEEDNIDESVIKDILDEVNYSINLDFENKVRRVKSKAEYQKQGDNVVIIHANFNQMLDNKDYLKTIVRTK